MNLIASLLCISLVAGCGPGAPGPQGPAGPPGPAGLSIVSQSSCFGFGAGSFSSLSLGYQSVTFTDASAWVDCYVSDATKEISASDWWPSGTVGAATKFCNVGYDGDSTANGGYLTATPTTAASVVFVYHDIGSPFDGQSTTLECAVH